MFWIYNVNRLGIGLFDTLTETRFRVNQDDILELSKYDWFKLANANIENNKVNINDKYLNLVTKNKSLIVTTQLGNKAYQIVSVISRGECLILKEDMERYKRNNTIANYIDDKFIDAVYVEDDEDFRAYVRNEIDKYKLKNRAMGNLVEVYYTVIGKNVILNNIESANGIINIPSVITHIGNGVLYGKCKKINIHNRIKAIASRAFEYAKIKEIDIPDSVEYFYSDILGSDEGVMRYNKDKTVCIEVRGIKNAMGL